MTTMKSSSIVLSNDWYTPGDLFYGIQQTRCTATDDLKLNTMHGFFTDWYNKLIMGEDGFHSDPAFNDKNSAIYASHESTKFAYSFHHFCLEFEKFDKRNEDASYFNPPKNHDEDKYSLSTKSRLKSCVRTRCKLAILWAVANGYKIHFMLDEGFNFAKCFNSKEYGYTNCELRFIYRNWENLKLSNQVIFWKEDKASQKFIQCQAPWDSDPTVVGNYKPKNSKKDRYNNFFDKLPKLAKAKELNQKIEAFKKLYLQLFNSQSGLFKLFNSNFLKGKESISNQALYLIIMAHIKKHPNGKGKKAWDLAEKHFANTSSANRILADEMEKASTSACGCW